MATTNLIGSGTEDNTPQTFREQRKAIAKNLRTAVHEVNRLLALALDAGIKVRVEVEGHPRFDVGAFGDSGSGQGRETAFTAWALRMKTFTSREAYPRGGTQYGAVAYCDWRASHE